MPRKFFRGVADFAVSRSILDPIGQYEVSLFVMSALAFRYSGACSIVMGCSK